MCNPVNKNALGIVIVNKAPPSSDGWTVWRKGVRYHSANDNLLITQDNAWAGHNRPWDVPVVTVPLAGASGTGWFGSVLYSRENLMPF
jgi:hypothetical protein